MSELFMRLKTVANTNNRFSVCILLWYNIIRDKSVTPK